MLSLLVNGTDVFTGDTLFKGSVGGVHAPGSTGFADIKSSIMDKLLKLPPETHIHPGHTDPTTVAVELEHNRFVRIWRGLDPEGDEPCTALGQSATLILLGDDYDGGHKAWVRWPDGSDDIVPGSRVQRDGCRRVVPARPGGPRHRGLPGHRRGSGARIRGLRRSGRPCITARVGTRPSGARDARAATGTSSSGPTWPIPRPSGAWWTRSAGALGGIDVLVNNAGVFEPHAADRDRPTRSGRRRGSTRWAST